MTNLEKAAVVFFGIILWSSYFYIKGCNKAPKVKVKLVDTSTYAKRSINAMYDQLNQNFINEIGKLEKENERLKQSAKTKIIYRDRILKDTIKTIEYSNESLDLCNQYSLFQDSIITNLENSLNLCELGMKNLVSKDSFNSKVIYSPEYNYKKLIFRLYLRSKNR